MRKLTFAALLVLLTLAAYHNAYRGPFLGDDTLAIPKNATIRHLWPLARVLRPPYDTTVNDRPVLNLSFALNYAISGTATWSYHALNVLFHLLAGLTLFGLVRRTLQRPVLRESFGAGADGVAFVSALLWMLHPIQTQCVTYIVERAESLMGLFYLLTLYCFARASDASGAAPRSGAETDSWQTQDAPPSAPLCGAAAGKPAKRVWLGLACLACLLSMETKEVAVTAPLMVLLYDRTFVSGSFRESWRRHWGFYLLLAATWLSFVPLFANGLRRDPTSGFGNGVPFHAYVQTQFHAIAHYLRVAFWPHPLLVYYYEPLSWILHRPMSQVLPYALLVVPLVAATAIALWRRPVPGFLGAWFFGILAPTSLVPGALDTTVDRRIYLSLAAIIVPVAAGIYLGLARRRLPAFLALSALPALALGILTERQNRIFSSDIALYRNQVAACPEDPRAHYNIGCALAHRNDVPGALREFQQSVQLDPRYYSARAGLGFALAATGRFQEAILQYRAALRLDPDDAKTHEDLGSVLGITGRLSDSIAEYEAAIRIDPDSVSAHYNLAMTLKKAGRIAEARTQIRIAGRLLAAAGGVAD